MPAQLAEQSQRMFDIVSKGPVPYEVLVADVAAGVHPGKAFRFAARQVDFLREKRGHDPREFSDPEGKKEQRIRYGALAIARKTISEYVSRGRLEVFTEDGVTMVRKTDKPVGVPSTLNAWTSPWSRLIAGMLGGEARFSDEDIHLAVSYLVPAERAARHAIRRREVARASASEPISGKRSGPKSYTYEQNVRIGRRDLVSSALGSLVKSDRIAVEKVDGVKYYSRGRRWVEPDASSV